MTETKLIKIRQALISVRVPLETLLTKGKIINDNNNNNANNNKNSLKTDFVDSKKLNGSKLAGYMFARYIALVPSMPLLAGFTVQGLLAVSLCQLAK